MSIAAVTPSVGAIAHIVKPLRLTIGTTIMNNLIIDRTMNDNEMNDYENAYMDAMKGLNELIVCQQVSANRRAVTKINTFKNYLYTLNLAITNN